MEPDHKSRSDTVSDEDMFENKYLHIELHWLVMLLFKGVTEECNAY